MSGLNIGVELGTENVTAFAQGKGLLLREPGVVAVDAISGRPTAFGADAMQLMGRTNGAAELKFPIRDGVVADVETTVFMLKRLIDKACGGSIVKPNVIACVPATLSSLEKKTIVDALFLAGAGRACLLPKPYAAAMGTGVNLSAPHGFFTADFGAGSVETAVVTMDDTAVSRSIHLGATTLTEDIQRYLRREKNVEVGFLTAERIKRAIGGASRREEEIALICAGKSVITDRPINFEVGSDGVYTAMREHLIAIRDGLAETLAATPPELVADVSEGGLVLSGGGARLYGLDRFLRKSLGIPVFVVNGPELCLANGLSKVVENVKLLKKSGFDDFCAILAISLGKELQSLCNALRRLQKAFPTTVLPYQTEDFLNVGRELLRHLGIILIYTLVSHTAKIQKKADTEVPARFV